MPSQAFPRDARLIRPSDFKRVFKQPLVSSDRYFRVLARRNDGAGVRLGMAVPRRVVRHANARNRIKRIVRESFRRHFAASGAAGGNVRADIVVLPRPGSDTISNAQLFRSLESHWVRIMAKCGAEPPQP